MSNDTLADTHGQLDAIWGGNEAPAMPIEDHKYVIISDLHLGNGGRADNFGHNREVFLQATRHYLEQQYCLILAGELEKKQRATAPAMSETSILPQLNAIDAEIAHEKERGRNFTPVEDTDTPIPCYFNSGCCCYKDGLTAIEIAGNQIALVKWSPQRVVFQSMPLEKCLTSI